MIDLTLMPFAIGFLVLAAAATVVALAGIGTVLAELAGDRRPVRPVTPMRRTAEPASAVSRPAA